MLSSSVFAAFLALLAAAAWGAGDFSGGLAARRVGAFRAVLVPYTLGMVVLVIVALARGEMLPATADVLWGAGAGLAGMSGLAFLLRGFREGRMGIVGPVSAVLTAAIPVVFAAVTQGLPGTVQLLGFAIALVALWLISRPQSSGSRPGGLGLALLAGLGFGVFFVALDQVSSGAVFWPLVVGRLAAVGVMLPLALARRKPVLPPGAPLGLLAMAGVLDATGNLFFLLATQTGRLDVAAVLGSLYPGVTALLAWLLAGEHLARPQVIGAAAALVAIVLITV